MQNPQQRLAANELKDIIEVKKVIILSIFQFLNKKKNELHSYN